MEGKGITTVNNTLIRDKELSLTAKGLGLLMLSFGNRPIVWDDIEGYGDDTTLEKSLTQLELAGYLKFIETEEGGAYDVADCPLFVDRGKKRTFSTSVTNSSLFLDMPKDAQLLYFHLVMNADDDGCVNAQDIIRELDCSAQDLMYLSVLNLIEPQKDSPFVSICDRNKSGLEKGEE